MTSTVAVILAAGRGTRMGSDLPKVLHELGGLPLVSYPLRAVRAAGVDTIVVVVGHGRERVEERIASDPDAGPVRFAVQSEQLGTGHAVLCALPALPDGASDALILSGDVPLVRAATLGRLMAARAATPARIAIATFRPPSPSGYGRIVRDAGGRVLRIREEVDASEAERTIGEVNAGIYCVATDVLREELPRLGRDNEKGEIYLTDLVARQAPKGPVGTVEVSATEVAGVNTPEQLAALESRVHQDGWGPERP